VTDAADQPAGKRVFCLYQALGGMIQQVNPAILWDHQPLSGTTAPFEMADILRRRDAIEDYVVTQVLLPFREEIAARREHETRVKEKYGLRSLDYLIQESNQKILDYQMRQAVGQQVEPEGIIYEPHTPGIVSHYEERAGYKASPGMRRDEEIEAVGMQVTMDYEREHGWHPEDVSGENHGFDVRSTLYNPEDAFADIRYIEVKARARSGAIRLSANEWKKARHFGEKFWLYVVTNAGTDVPQLHLVQNPVAHFRMGEGIFATGFIIPLENWLEHTEKEN